MSTVDESTLKSFYESTREALWRTIAGLTRDDALADDVFQETYVRFLQSDAEWRSDEQMKSYLYRIATNVIRDEWRKRKHRARWSEATEEPAADTTTAADLRQDVRQVFDRLPPQQRSLLWLAYAEEFEHREIADILKLKEKSVKVLLFRARRRLAALLRSAGIASETTP